MGFFKDFKDDFSQALNELLPGDDFTGEDDIQVNTLDNELDVEQELSKLDGLLEQVEKKSSRAIAAVVPPEPELRPLDELEENILDESAVEEPAADEVPEAQPEAEKAPELTEIFEAEEAPETGEALEPEKVPEVEETPEAEKAPEVEEAPEVKEIPEVKAVLEVEEAPEVGAVFEAEEAPEVETVPEPEPVAVAMPKAEKKVQAAQVTASELHKIHMKDIIKEEKTMDTMDTMEKTVTGAAQAAEAAVEAEISAAVDGEVTDEVSLITAGTCIKGNMETTGSFEIEGKIEGDIKCNGKLTVIGSVVGNSASSEFFADAAHVEGEVVSSGTVKVGLGSVIIGNITATSAVIAGAVKGDIDVQGPVVVDTSAVIMGNIKSRSVQINNGAVIEGFCSQCYSDVDVESLFAKNN